MNIGSYMSLLIPKSTFLIRPIVALAIPVFTDFIFYLIYVMYLFILHISYVLFEEIN